MEICEVRCDDSMRDIGIIGYHICGKPVFQDGLCARHFKKRQKRAIPYGKREGYREPTIKELKEGRTVYLKTMGSYGGHQYRKGIMIRASTHTSSKVPPLADPSLFVIKINPYVDTQTISNNP